MLVVTTDTGTQATVESSGLTVDGASLNVTGDGTFAVAGPLSLNDGGWVESDIDAIWTGSAPWRIGGAAGSPLVGLRGLRRAAHDHRRDRGAARGAQATA